MKEFYIGYLAKMPAGYGLYIRLAVIAILAAATVFAAMFALGQKPFANGVFEFGNVKEFTGTIQAKPIPFLIVESGERNNGLPGLERIALVSEGKFGADDQVNGLDGKRVKLKGTLIYRDRIRMIEVAADSIIVEGGEPANGPGPETALGEMSLKGEIIDSKCYLGVMNPGNHKTHRSCAVACLRGGVPAMFLVKDKAGNKSELWLLSEKGEPMNERILEYVAEPVELKGKVYRNGDSLFFHADISNIRRLP